MEYLQNNQVRMLGMLLTAIPALVLTGLCGHWGTLIPSYAACLTYKQSSVAPV